MTKEESSEIKFTVHLDENKVPETIEWGASDPGEKGECKATMINIWDSEAKNTLRIDLWTKDMEVDDMKIFFHQTLLSMSDTLARATGEEALATEMRDFAQGLGEKMGIIKRG